MLAHVAGLTNQLIQTLLLDDAGPALIRVRTVTGTGSSTIELHAKPDRLSTCPRTQHEVQIPSVETVHDPARGGSEQRLLRINGPRPSQRPLIQVQRARGRVSVRVILHDAPR